MNIKKTTHNSDCTQMFTPTTPTYINSQKMTPPIRICNKKIINRK